MINYRTVPMVCSICENSLLIILHNSNNSILVDVHQATIFAASMKKIAIILILLFVLVQVAPAVYSFFSVQTGLFLVDEEKSSEKTDKNETKEIKNFHASQQNDEVLSQKLQTAFLLAEKIALSPCLEKYTPPPDHI